MSFHGKILVPLDVASIQLIEWNHALFSYDICPTEFCSVFVSPVGRALAAEHTVSALLCLVHHY